MLCTRPSTISVLTNDFDENGYRIRKTFTVGCGHCPACKKLKASQWSLRLILESFDWQDVSCLTLTYDEEKIPENGSLVVKDVQDWLKRFRKRSGLTLKYYLCGEYGDDSDRPHYHAILFGVPASDEMRELVYETWNKGITELKILRDERFIRYVAGYVQKKLYDDDANIKYTLMHRIPPFTLQSKGLGVGYLERHSKELYERLAIRFHGSDYALPRYFRKKLGVESERIGVIVKNNEQELLQEFYDRYGNTNEAIHRLWLSREQYALNISAKRRNKC